MIHGDLLAGELMIWLLNTQLGRADHVVAGCCTVLTISKLSLVLLLRSELLHLLVHCASLGIPDKARLLDQAAARGLVHRSRRSTAI